MVQEHRYQYVCVGTIFSILPAKNAVTQAEDFMQQAVSKAAAALCPWSIDHDGINSRRWRCILYFRSRPLKTSYLTADAIQVVQSYQRISLSNALNATSLGSIQ